MMKTKLGQYKKNQSGFMRGGAILAMGFISALVIAGISIQFPGLDPITQIDFTGEFNKVNKKQLAASIESVPRKNYFLIDVESMRSLLTALPWVEDVKIDRVWPDRLNIDVREKKAIARWAKGGLLNRDGRLFYPNKTDYPAGLTLVSPLNGMNAEIANKLNQFNQSLSRINLTIIKLVVDDRGVWQLTLNNGCQLIVGRRQLVQRVERFVAVLPRLGNESNLVAVDLRYANGIAIRMKNKHLGKKNNG